jgi:ankyrin repeat protein
MARKKAQQKQAQETTLVRHRTPNLWTLLQRAKGGASAQAVKDFLDAGGLSTALVEQVPLLHYMALHNSHPHTDLAESVRLLIEAGADIDAMSRFGAEERTALMCASERSCCSNVMQAFLQNGADFWLTTADGITALHIAAAAECTDNCEVLLAKDIELVHARDEMGRTALVYAVAYGSLDTVQLLCQYDADMLTEDHYGMTLLMTACMHERFDMASFLLNAGVDVNAVDEDDVSALIKAVQSNSFALVQLLLDHGADINATDEEGKNIMITAARIGNVKVMEYLVQQHGFDVTAVDSDDGSTLLMVAADKGQKAAAEWLIQQGVAVDTTDDVGLTTLHYACLPRSDDVGMVELLLANGADVTKCARHVPTALDLATGRGNIECARALITAGIDVNRPQSGGVSCLHFAITKPHASLVELLLQHGATAVMDRVIPSICDHSGAECCSGQTALMLCTETDTVKVLLAAGANVNTVNNAGDTCLHVAVRHKLSAPVICLMIKAGVDLHAVNNEGKTAAQIAHDKGYTLTEQLLVRAAQQA